jgi:hypothetical protein
MATTFDDLKTKAELVYNATQVAENTQKRVGRALLDIVELFEELEKIYLHKNKDDEASGKLKFDDIVKILAQVEFGSYVTGIAGKGGIINSNGDAELNSLTLRRFLEVPELRYNRIDITIGNYWRAPGGGIIESVTPDTDSDGNILSTGTITLHLEDGEIGTVAVDDICMGIWHDEETPKNNSEDDYDDGIGNFRFSGFNTVYFRVTEILEMTRNSKFRYSLRPIDDRYTKQNQPKSSMKFVSYGNFTNKNRQKSEYATRSYRRYLTDVNTWEIGQANISMQTGDLTNLSVFGLSMTGYSAYLNNIYMSGVIDQFVKMAPKMEITNSLDGFLGYGETCTLTCKVTRAYEDLTNTVKRWTVTRDSGDATEDASWALKDKVKNFAGSIEIAYTDKENDLGTNANVPSTVFTFTAYGDTDVVITQGTVEIK